MVYALRFATVVALLVTNVNVATAGNRPYLPNLSRTKKFTERSVRVPTLLYHYVRVPPEGDALGKKLSVSPTNFKKQLDFLVRQGYAPVDPERIYQYLWGVGQLPNKPVLLTFDDGTEDIITTVFPLLEAYGFPATVFVVPAFVETHGYLTWNQLRRLSRSPLITIGAHGLNHASLTALDVITAERQLILSKNLLASVTRQRVDVVAYPNGSHNLATAESAGRAGYLIGFTTVRGTTVTRGKLLELPRIRAGESVATLRRALSTP